MTDAPEAPAVAPTEGADASTNGTTVRRGRPRPAATIERDKQVLQYISADGKTREEIVAALAAASTPLEPNQVYLSLYRLRKDGLVARVRDGSAHRWVTASEQAPAPEPAPVG